MTEKLTNKMETSNNNFTGEGPSIIVQELHGPLIAHSIHQRYSETHQSETRERKPICHNIKPPVPSFTGRKDEQKELQAYLQHQNEESSTLTAAVIIGLGGTGKTELARAYAHENSGYYENIVWIDSETSGTMRYTFETLAIDLGIIKDEAKTPINKTTENNEREEKRRLEVILPKVYNFLNETKTLLIFDNAEGFPTIKPFLPPLSKENIKKIHILLTSQVKEWKVMDEYITFNECHLEDLLPEHAKEFVKRQLIDICDDDIDKLIEAVGCFPLALTQAVAFIYQQREITQKLSEKTYDIADYLKVFRDETWMVLDNVNTIIHHPYAKTVYKNLGLTIDKLSKEKNGQEAVNVLTIVAFLAPDDIHVKEMFEGDENAFLLLDKYSMMKIVAGVASIHRLLQQVIRLRNQDKEIATLKKALSVISDRKGLNDGIYLNHVMFVWTYAIKHKVFAQKVTSHTYTCTWRNYYPLQIFILNNNYEGAQDLLANIPVGKRKKVCNFKGIWDGTPLDAAFETKSSLNFVKLLVKNGANVSSDELHRAVINKAHLDVVKYLIKNGAKVNAKDGGGETPLHVAIDCNKHFELVQCLIGNGADVNSRNKYGETPLHKVVGCIKRYNLTRTPCRTIVEIIAKILIENGAEMNAKNEEGETPLHKAIRYYDYEFNAELVRFLIENGAEVNVPDNRWITPLHSAIAIGYDEELVKYLIENGAAINAKDKDGRTALHTKVALSHNTDHILAYRHDVLKLLIECSADVNAKDENGRTALHVARYDFDIEFLLQNGSIVNAKDKDGRTPLHTKVALYHNPDDILDCVKLLISYGADVNAKDENGKTPLHKAVAADETNQTVIDFLLQNGSDVNAKDKNGKTPLHEAAYCKNLDIIDFLIKNGADIEAKDKYGAAYNSFINTFRIS